MRCTRRLFTNKTCKNLAGGYTDFRGIGATRKTCTEGMDTEAAFRAALNNFRKRKIDGQRLELYDADGNPLARLAARQMK